MQGLRFLISWLQTIKISFTTHSCLRDQSEDFLTSPALFQPPPSVINNTRPFRMRDACQYTAGNKET